jgi:hypothetical protein
LGNSYTDNILKELTKLKFNLELEYGSRRSKGEDLESLQKELNEKYTKNLWRIL